MSNDMFEKLSEESIANIGELQKVTKEKDGEIEFQEAQSSIIDILIENELFIESLSILRNLRKDADQQSLYYKSLQFRIADVLLKIGDKNGAIYIWKNMKDYQNKSFDVIAQILAGKVLKDQGELEEAKKIWGRVRDLKTHPQASSEASLLIGQVLAEEGQSNEALEVWSEITRMNTSSGYAKAKFNKGNILVRSGKYDEALKEWASINIEDNSEMYIKANLNIDYLKNITKIDETVIDTVKVRDNYSKCSIKDVEKALVNWKDKNSKHYAYAQLKLGERLCLTQNPKDIEKAIIAFNVSKIFYPYESYNYIEVCMLLECEKTKSIGELSLSLITKVENILDIMVVDSERKDFESKAPERKLAHYTSNHVMSLLCVNDELNFFRLNTINNVNDPSEGKLLLDYLKEVNTDSFLQYNPNFDETLQAFVSCFTFNHDSLNQFRLYGKQDNKEASGISMVFNSDFFLSNELEHRMPFPLLESAIISDIKNNNNLVDIVDINNEDLRFIEEYQNSVREKAVIGKQRIMRCVYLDPVSEYIHLAQRSKLTFFKEFQDEPLTKEIAKDTKLRAKYEWNAYRLFIDNTQAEFTKEFKEMKALYMQIVHIYEENLKNYLDIQEYSNKLLEMIILPLKYLIKHSAFQEEEECRMIYITSLKRPEVNMDFGNYLFVEYGVKVKNSLDKVYIAPAATKYQPYLAKLLSNTEVNIELSNNPYRQT